MFPSKRGEVLQQLIIDIERSQWCNDRGSVQKSYPKVGVPLWNAYFCDRLSDNSLIHSFSNYRTQKIHELDVVPAIRGVPDIISDTRLDIFHIMSGKIHNDQLILRSILIS